MRLIDKKVAIITGGARGIGESIARKFLIHGAYVAIVDQDEEQLRRTTKTLMEEAPNTSHIIGRPIDVTDTGAFNEVSDEVISRFGKIDILVNNAAIEAPVTLLDCTLVEWNRVLSVNLTAYFTCARIVAQKMIATARPGKLINIGSVQSVRSEAGSASYATSKAGIEQLTRSLAIELAPHDIMVNSLRLGFIKTRLSLRPDGTDETETEYFKEFYVRRRKIPLARAGCADEVAGAALFFASDLCSYVTGATLTIDGGLSITL
ncbi:MAG: SDR family oxidoreductase [Chloracidobacterium sp.]|nr:SDR family oxidoreductase [Chloracidobacterium sp.]